MILGGVEVAHKYRAPRDVTGGDVDLHTSSSTNVDKLEERNSNKLVWTQTEALETGRTTEISGQIGEKKKGAEISQLPSDIPVVVVDEEEEVDVEVDVEVDSCPNL